MDNNLNEFQDEKGRFKAGTVPNPLGGRRVNKPPTFAETIRYLENKYDSGQIKDFVADEKWMRKQPAHIVRGLISIANTLHEHESLKEREFLINRLEGKPKETVTIYSRPIDEAAENIENISDEEAAEIYKNELQNS
jgi:flagellar motility protein MotE (MotC chaperone)